MTPQLIAHAYGTVAGGALTTVRADLCTIVRLAQGIYRVTVAHDGCARGDLKMTVNVTGAAARLYTILPQSSLLFDVHVCNAASVATDPTAIWVTIERLPRAQ